MKTRKSRGRPALLQCERLENRMALSGDVSLALNSAGALVVTGGKGANHVSIVGNADGSVTVSGLDHTRIHFNGTLDSDATVQITQPINNLTVKLGKGNDTLLLSNATIGGTTDIDAGGGS